MQLFSQIHVFTVLTLYVNNHPGDRKGLRKLLLKLLKKVPVATRMALIDPMLVSKDPEDVLDYHVRRHNHLTNTAQTLCDDDNSGMLIHEGEIHGAQVWFTNPDGKDAIEEDMNWALDNELVIACSIAQSYKNQLGLDKILCDVIMFSSRGFSGHAMKIGVWVGNDGEPQARRYAGDITLDRVGVESANLLSRAVAKKEARVWKNENQ